MGAFPQTDLQWPVALGNHSSGYCRRISRRSLFRARSVAPPKQCKGRHKSGPAPVRSVQSIDFLSTITGFVFQFFDKRMIAYGFVPVGGPGPAKMSGLAVSAGEHGVPVPCRSRESFGSPLARRRSLPRTNRPFGMSGREISDRRPVSCYRIKFADENKITCFSRLCKLIKGYSTAG